MKIHPPKSIFLSLMFISFLFNPIINTQASFHTNNQANQIPFPAPYSQNNANLTPHQAQTEPECNFQFEELHRGALKDAIRSIDSPRFVDPTHDMAPEDPRQKVIGITIDGIARAYPYNILSWHEIVNDDFNGNKVSITYCPLTGSGLIYPAGDLNDTQLGVSGLLFENNLVFYECDTGKHWSQMGGFVVKGQQLAGNIDYVESIETTWETWLKLHPDTKVLSTQTQLAASYDRYPYGAYLTDRSIYFPTTFNDNIEPYNLYHEKELTQIIQFDNDVLLLPFEELSKIQVLNHNFVNQDLFTLYVDSEDLAITYYANINGTKLDFTSYEDDNNVFNADVTFDLPLFIDNLENIWNIKGLAISGPLIGTQLKIIPTYNAFWFAATSFYYDASILIVDDSDTSTSVVLSSFSVTPEVQEQGSLQISPFYVIGLVTLAILRYGKRKIEV
ncbi:MAG: hypothetical protein HeimC2_11280 [Candidatus Heimdallarchaeota archaeon LC_2]|nr:MAG: hypothetical protein HeimC2_11280 [Candidatus Heimdallarchaeota archaeon LC_2]